MLSNEARAIQTLFFIQDKQGRKVPFLLRPAQVFLDQEETNRIIIAKARQKTFSSGITAKFAIRCMGREGTHAVVMSHEASATQRLMDKVQYYLKYMRGPKPVFGRNSRQELYFPKTESTYYIGTAGSRTFGRGDWITDLHCSEYAWWEDPVQHQAGVFQAVPSTGRIVIESTGNGRKRDFYYIWKHADAMGYKRLFFPWFGDDEYTLPVSSWQPDLPKYNGYMLDLQKKFKLSDQHMAWYERKLKEMRENLKLMQQEYPSEPEDCFQATGGALFHAETSYHSFWKTERTFDYFTNKLVNHPIPNLTYVIGCDPSGGVGNDDTAFQVFCAQTLEQVLELFNPNINPIECARLLAKLGDLYNKAYLVVEGNNHGLAVIPLLKELYDKNLIYKSKLATKSSPSRYGWWNSDHTKHALVGLVTEELEQVVLYGKQTVDELNSFEETEEGRMEGESDNCVIATGLAMIGLKKFEYLKGTHIPKLKIARPRSNYMSFTLDEVLKEFEKRRGGSGIFGRQVGEGYPYA